MSIRKSRPTLAQSGELVLVNRAHPLAAPQAPALCEVEGALPGILLECRAAAALSAWLNAAGLGGAILPVSGYRSRTEQENIYRSAIVKHGREFAETYVTWPGCSEHESGLAVDLSLAGEEINFFTPELPYDGIASPLRRLAAAFGFVLRYPDGRQGITGIGHEPWHFRFVGRLHAAIMERKSLVLEEYIEMLQMHGWQHTPLYFEDSGAVYRLWYLPHRDLEAFLSCAGDVPLHLWADNAGGYVAASRSLAL